VRLSAKSDYAIRAVIELAAIGSKAPVPAEVLAEAQAIPLRFLLAILAELRHAGIVASRRGSGGGYVLALPADRITIADVIRVVEGPLAQIGDLRPDEVSYQGTAVPLRDVWIAVRAGLRAILEHVTVDDVVSGNLPSCVTSLLADPDAWTVHYGRARPGVR